MKPRSTGSLDDLWWRGGRGGPALPALSAAEVLYRGGAALRGALYRAGLVRPALAGVPVISIGNLTVGGAGKTPAAATVAQRLQQRGRRVAVLSRGYAARRRDPRVVSDGATISLSEADAGDEPLLLARRLPGVAVLCGPSRVMLARMAVEGLGADALVLDDGFQHRALARDLDVVVLDAASPVGNGRLLPRGPNREPWSALGRAQLGWISRADQAPPAAVEALRVRVRAAVGRDPVVSRHAIADVLDGGGASRGRDALRGRRVLMLCALARPEGFRATLASLGATVAAERIFRDHHRFAERELDEALAAARAGHCEALATTEKDAVRLAPRVAADPLWRVVRIDMELLAGGEILDRLLDDALARGDARRAAGAARGAPGARAG